MIKKPAISPIDGLVDLACRDGVDVRPTLLRVLTDLYVQKPAHSADEQAQYVELALGLIDTVDAATHAAVTARLSAYAGAPAALLDRLSGTRKTAESPATAAVQPITDANPEASGQPGSLVDVFFGATAEERRLILLNLDIAATGPAQNIGPVSAEIIKRLEMAALQRNAGEFSRILERALGIGRDMAERVARDRSGEPIVVAARALGMKGAVLQRILLFLNPAVGQSVQRVYDLVQLFEELSLEAAQQMLAIWRMANTPAVPLQKAGNQPVYNSGGARDARLPMSAPAHRSAGERAPLPERLKSTR